MDPRCTPLRSLPKFRPDSGQDFFQVFGEVLEQGRARLEEHSSDFKAVTQVFRRNARFSVKRPVPDLGSLEEPAKHHLELTSLSAPALPGRA